ncbi:MAG: ABC transporter ATP-binding protein [Promethearchaeota archaeon]|jgi:ABC-2 type transport system ATP-binding protein
MHSVLKVDNVRKSFGKNIAVDGISFEVYEGELFGILGPNGAGKSTTLSIITGLVRPNSGDVSIFGIRLKTNFVKAINNLGILVETPGFYNHLTAYENLILFSRLRRVKKDEIISTLEQVGLSDHAKRKVKDYSLGMKRRLGLANALLGQPRILVLDEPTNGLDQKGVKRVLELILALSKREKISVVISSNLLHDIEAICDRVLLIDKGRTIFCESLSELIKPVENSFNIKVIPTKNAIHFLKQIDGVIHIELIESNVIKVVLSNNSASELNRLLIEKGYDVFEITPVRRTLRELFLELKG